MKFSTAIMATALLASTAFAVPAAEPELKTRGLVRAGKFGYCIAPGQMCYKTKRHIDQAIEDVITGYEAPLPEEIEKRGFPATGGAYDGGSFTGGEGEVEAVENPDGFAWGFVGFGELADVDHERKVC